MSSLLPSPLPQPLAAIFRRRYKLFISHAWEYQSDYDGLVNLLNDDKSFSWDNLSVPADNPFPLLASLPKSYRYLVKRLEKQISEADCLVVIAGMYVAHRGWIQSEVEAALEFQKPIIAVLRPWQERIPEAVK